MTDNVAIPEGYTKGVFAHSVSFDMHLLIKSDTDLDQRFRAWDLYNQEYVNVNGWLFEFEEEVEL